MQKYPYIVELEFEVIQNIRSLPPLHGARWSALLRFACQRVQINMEDVILGILPWRSGVRPMLQGEVVGLRLLVAPQAHKLWQALLLELQGEHAPSRKSEDTQHAFALHDSLQLQRVYCGLSGITLYDRQHFKYNKYLDGIEQLSMAHILAIAHALCRAYTWQLHFFTPLRMTRVNDSMRKQNIFADAQYFIEQSHAINSLIKKIRYLEKEENVCQYHCYKQELQWHDMRYNEQRKIALGGLMGTAHMKGKVHFNDALRLALGEYTGVGKNARFGLGFYKLSFQE